MSREGTGNSLPVVGAKPVERHVQLGDVSAKKHKVPDLFRPRETNMSQEASRSLSLLLHFRATQQPSGSPMTLFSVPCPFFHESASPVASAH